MKKSEIRKQIKLKKNQLTDLERFHLSKFALSNLESLDDFKSGTKIGLYHSLNDEVCTHTFIEKWNPYKELYLPRIVGDNLEMVKYIQNDDLNKGLYNIFEPGNNQISSLNNLDLIIIPAVALSKSGQRIGRGKGYYDRLLSGYNILRIGLIYDFQLCETFESEPHDIPVDIIVTDKQIIYLNK